MPPPSSGHIFSREGPAAAARGVPGFPLTQRKRHGGAWGCRERPLEGEEGAPCLTQGELWASQGAGGTLSRPSRLWPWFPGGLAAPRSGWQEGSWGAHFGETRGGAFLGNACSPPPRSHSPLPPSLEQQGRRPPWAEQLLIKYSGK